MLTIDTVNRLIEYLEQFPNQLGVVAVSKGKPVETSVVCVEGYDLVGACARSR
jgi:hypothetical protein